MAIKVAINGFGRIGRYLVRACLGNEEVKIVAINSRAKPETLAHLLKYDSVHRTFDAHIDTKGNSLLVNGAPIAVTGVTSALADLPWGDLGVDVVLETTGNYKKREILAGHLTAGARKVIIGYPGKDVDGTFVMGVNEESYDPSRHHIISNASCTTNCLAPLASVVNDEFTIVKGLMTTVHSYTMDQRLLDGSHSDLRRGRAAAMSIVPTSTGAAAAVGEVLPALKGKLDGLALRVPTPNVSLVDLSVELAKNTTPEEVNLALKRAADGKLKGILHVSEEELVSIDFTSSSYSSIVDAPLTRVIQGNFLKIFSWYDNESGFSCRMRDLAIHIGRRSSR
ncbi:MAG: type I glyceraldehyde-3-phosphate dehydrogenase [Smithellaceae bacterium]|nr:type I glyceraldehyde-3-phosphate dehydrogenase [Smithellaceae bacterium]